MRGRVLRWLHVTLPRDLTLIFMLCYSVIEATFLFCQLKFGQFGWRGDSILKVRDIVMLTAAASYGVSRVVQFHPIFQPAYLRWLNSTPWTAQKPLPLGPVHLVVQDVFMLGLLAVLMHDPQVNRLWLPVMFGLGYLACSGVALFATGVKWAGYVLAIGLGLPVLLLPDHRLALTALAVLYGMAWIGLRQSLARFPWSQHPGTEGLSISEILERQWRLPGKKALLGWPYGSMAPAPDEYCIAHIDAALVSLAVCFWIYVPLSHVSRFVPMGAEDVYEMFKWLSAMLVLNRNVVYYQGRRSPINLVGRIMTLRWLIPGYDRVWVGHVCMLLVAYGVLKLCIHLDLSASITSAASIFTTVLMVLAIGPTYRRWDLTGSCRIVPGGLVKRSMKEFEEL